MEKIIQKAIEGGYNCRKEPDGEGGWRINGLEDRDENYIVLDCDFWKALGKSCRWEGYSPHDVTSGEAEYLGDWIGYAIEFYSINITEGWDKAISWLEELVSNGSDK